MCTSNKNVFFEINYSKIIIILIIVKFDFIDYKKKFYKKKIIFFLYFLFILIETLKCLYPKKSLLNFLFKK